MEEQLTFDSKQKYNRVLTKNPLLDLYENLNQKGYSVALSGNELQHANLIEDIEKGIYYHDSEFCNYYVSGSKITYKWKQLKLGTVNLKTIILGHDTIESARKSVNLKSDEWLEICIKMDKFGIYDKQFYDEIITRKTGIVLLLNYLKEFNNFETTISNLLFERVTFKKLDAGIVSTLNYLGGKYRFGYNIFHDKNDMGILTINVEPIKYLSKKQRYEEMGCKRLIMKV